MTMTEPHTEAVTTNAHAAGPTVLCSAERVTQLADGLLTTVTIVDAGEICFAGHYPGFPILPGVLLIEAVHRAVRRYAAERLHRDVRLCDLRRVRFSSPVFPGDQLTTECVLALDGDALTVTARCSTGRGRAASIKAGYALTDPRPNGH